MKNFKIAREEEWLPYGREGRQDCSHCDASNVPGTCPEAATKISDACQKKLVVLEHATNNAQIDTQIDTHRSLHGLDGVPHSWLVHMMLQRSGLQVYQKFADVKLTRLFNIQNIEDVLRWNKLAYMHLVNDIKEAVAILLDHCTVPFDVILRNTYSESVTMWSEKYLRRCFDVNEIFWISCEDLFTRTRDLVLGVHDDDPPKLQPNASRPPSFECLFGFNLMTPNSTTNDNFSSEWLSGDESESLPFWWNDTDSQGVPHTPRSSPATMRT